MNMYCRQFTDNKKFSSVDDLSLKLISDNYACASFETLQMFSICHDDCVTMILMNRLFSSFFYQVYSFSKIEMK